VRSLALLLILVALARPALAEPLEILARPGPWSTVSELIGFDGRLWFVNSNPSVNHNAADLYSYDPSSGATRYEAGLFSQGAGDPVVHGGRLYWPFEDPRFSALRGEYMVTDGEAWGWHGLPDGLAFHVHAMTSIGDRLYAATSAWRAGLQVSDDGGTMWRILHDHPTPDGQVSRITALVGAHGTLYAGFTQRRAPGSKLLRLENQTLVSVDAWPDGRRVDALAAFGEWLYGTNGTADGLSLWRFDGDRAERVHALDGHAVRDLAAGAGALWAVTGHRGAGKLWRTRDGEEWHVLQSFENAMPAAVAIHAGEVYVGASGPDSRGTLWGPAAPGASVGQSSVKAIAALPPQAEIDITGHLATLDRAFADPMSYENYGGGLRRAIAPLAGNRSPELGIALSERLQGPFPDISVQLFTDAFVVTATEMAQWALLRAIALNGHGRVPLELIATPWRAAPNDAEKYFEPAPAAAWAAGQLRQDDAQTIAALIDRLDNSGDPPWLAGDMIAALTVLTGQRIGHDFAAWKHWERDQPMR
jgi:hypothetical protein